MLFRKNKHELEDDGDELDLDDIDEFDDDLFGDDEGGSRKPSKKQLAKTATKAAVKTSATEMASKFSEDLIPGEFEANLMEARDLANYTRDLIKESADEVTGALSKVLPEKVRKLLGIRERSSAYSTPSKDEQRSAAIEGALDSIFSKQSQISEKMEEIDKANQEAAVNLSNLASNKLQSDMISALTNEMTKLTSFMTSIGSSYFRKSLELQYKSYYIHLDQLNVTSKYMKAMSEQLDSVIKNTALPEHVKVNQADRISGRFKEALAEKTFETIYSNNALIKRIKTNLKDRVRDYKDSAKEAIELIGGSLEMSRDAGVSSSVLAADTAGGLAGSWLSNRLYKRLKPHLQERLGDNEFLRNLGFGMENAIKNTGGVIESIKERADTSIDKLEGESGLRNRLAQTAWRGIRGLTTLADGPETNFNLQSESIDTFKKAAVFDNNIYRSISEAIPMYLSRIQTSTEDLKRMYHIVNQKALPDFKSSSGLVYNYLDRKLTTETEYKARLEGFARTSGNGKLSNETGNIVSGAISGLSKDKRNIPKIAKLKKVDSKELTKYIDTMTSIDGFDVSFDNLIRSAGTSHAPKEVQEYLRNNPNMVGVLKNINQGLDLAGDETLEKVRKSFNVARSNVDSVYPVGTIIETISEISKIARPDDVVNKPTKDEANIYGKLLTTYLSKNDTHLHGGIKQLEKINTSIPSILSKEELDKIRDSYRLFMNDCVNINDIGTKEDKQRMILAFGKLSEEIRRRVRGMGDGTNKSVDLHSRLREMMPSLYGDRKSLTTKEILGLGIGYGDNELPDFNYASSEDVEELLDLSEIKVKESGDAIADSRLLKGIEDTVGRYSKVVKESDSLVGAFRNVARVVTDDTKKVLRKQYDNLTNTAEKLGNIAKDLSAKGIDRSLIAFSNELLKMGDQIEKMMEREEKDYNESLNTLNTLLSNMRENNPESVGDIVSQIDELKENRTKRLSSYKLLNDSLSELRREVSSISSDEIGENLSNKITRFRDVLTTKLSEFNNILDFAKKEDL